MQLPALAGAAGAAEAAGWAGAAGAAGLAGAAGATGAAVLGLIFLRAAWHKFGAFGEFAGIVADYGVLPERLAALLGPVAALLAVAEAATVVLLALPATRPAGAILAATLLSLYGLAMARNILRGRRAIDCGCGGAPTLLSGPLLVRNAVLAALALLVALAPAAALSPAGVVGAVAGGLLLFVAYAAIDEVLATHARIGVTP